MGLLENVVVVNEFSVPRAGGGTRGSTPGAYVTRYMARHGAVEPMAPVRRDAADDFVTRYMLREGAVQAWPDDAARAKADMREAQRLGGLALGCAGGAGDISLSMSDAEVKAVASRIQELFDSGHTVMKTVVSFADDYLKENGIVPADFVHRARGDWAEHVDEARLRSAIASGMRRLSARFDDLVWVGCVQVDAGHVHCHLCMTDAGVGRLTAAGEQKGKLSDTDMLVLRRGIDDELDRTQTMRHLSADVGSDRADVKAYVRRLSNEAIARHGVPQFLVACLPRDKRLWRASSTSKKMRKADAIVRLYVEEILASPKSGYREAMGSVFAYAKERAGREGDPGSEGRYVAQGQKRLIDGCVDAVYGTLKEMPEWLFEVRTRIMDVMSVDMAELARARSADPILEFGMRLRSYSARLAHHKEKRAEFRAARLDWERADAAGMAAPDSAALHRLYLEEERYHEALVAKYLHFLQFLPPDDEWEEEMERWAALEARARLFETMAKDPAFTHFKSAERAEAYGEASYGVGGGADVFSDRDAFARRAKRFRDEADRFGDDLRAAMADAGVVLEMDEEGHVGSHPGTSRPFDEVKALDLHHLDYDFTYDAPVSERNVRRFLEATQARSQALAEAMTYLQDTGQEAQIEALPVEDVELMVRRARELTREERPTIPSAISDAVGIRPPMAAPRLDSGVDEELRLAVRRHVQTVALEAGL